MFCGGGQQFRNPRLSMCSMCSCGPRCQLKQVPYICYHSCSSNNQVTTHSPRQLSPLKWLLIKSVCVFMEGRLSFALTFQLITEWKVSDTCQNTGWGGGHGAILQVPWEATTTGWTGLIKNCTRGGRILFFKTITSISGGQNARVCEADNSIVKEGGKISRKRKHVSVANVYFQWKLCWNCYICNSIFV